METGCLIALLKCKIAVVIGSIRPNRFATIPAEWIVTIAKAWPDIEIEVIDLLDFPLPLFAEASPPAHGASKSSIAGKWQSRIDEFDGFIFTVAEYNHGPTAALKNSLDYAHEGWRRKPVGFIGYGGVGGARAIEQLRLYSIELHMIPTKTAVHIGGVDFLMVSQGRKRLSDFVHLNQSAGLLINEIAWWAKLLKVAREADMTVHTVKQK